MADRHMQIRGGQIKDGTISEAKLDITNAPVDGYFLRYNETEGKFEWVAGTDAVTEIPVGLINGVNQSFTITNTPQAGTIHIYLNGLYQEEGSGKDYQLSGTDITFVQAPDTDDIVIAAYLKNSAGSSLQHEQNTDQYLDFGGANQSSAADVKDAVDKKHEHTNNAELDLVSDGDHDVRADNPHGVDKTDVGLTNVPDLDTTDAVNNEHSHINSAELNLVSDGDHDVRSDNPHGVDKTDVGLSNVPNLDTTDAVNNEHDHTNKTQLDLVTDGDHDVRSDNPHSVSKSHVGLANVDNVNSTVSNLQYVLDGGDLAITTGNKGQIEIPFDCTITDAVLIADQTGSIVVDIKKSTYAGFPTTASIAASAKPTLSSSQKMKDSTLTGWTVTLSAGDIIEYVVDSASTVTRVLVSLKVNRT